MSVVTESDISCYKADQLTKEKNFFLYTDESLTQQWANETEISVFDDEDALNLGFGFSLELHTDKFWNRNFTLWYELVTRGQVRMTKQLDIQIGPNCALEEFNVTTLDGQEFPDDTTHSVRTIQMVINPSEATLVDDGYYHVDFLS